MKLGFVLFSILSCLTLFKTQLTFAYPNAISMDYPSCINCHYHPAGNGILTDYGRTIGVNSYSSKPFWAPNAKEETIEKFGDFLFPGFNSIQKYIWHLYELSSTICRGRSPPACGSDQIRQDPRWWRFWNEFSGPHWTVYLRGFFISKHLHRVPSSGNQANLLDV